ncbi:MAG: hypothetical protein WD405_06515 [Homoserinimonas sp.]
MESGLAARPGAALRSLRSPRWPELFEAAGFEVVSQPTPSRALVRLDLR